MQSYTKIITEHIDFFKLICNDRVYCDSEKLQEYSYDETEDLSFPPEVVLKPNSVEEISKILSFCNENKIFSLTIKATFSSRI